MALDQYADCPGWTGKKIKFCGCKDILPDLERIERAIEGEQLHAAQQAAEQALRKHPERACLLAYNTKLHHALQQYAQFADAAEQFASRHPTNPLALAADALGQAARGNVDVAIGRIQDCLDQTGGDSPPHLLAHAAIEASARLSPLTEFAASQALAWIGGVFETELGDMARQRAESLMRAPLPPLLKFGPPLLPAGDDAPAAYRQAGELTDRARWRAAAALCEQVLAAAPQDLPALESLAMLRAFLNQREESAAAWRRLAAAPGVSEDAAREAEARAQLLEPTEEQTDRRQVVLRVRDAAALQERLLSDRRVRSIPDEEWRDDGPPPRGVFELLDAPPVESPETPWEQWPRFLAEAALYGKQTDREAELVLLVWEDQRAGLDRVLREVGGELLGETASDEVDAWQPRRVRLLQSHREAPPGMSVEALTQAEAAECRERLLREWAETPLRVVDGLKPSEAALNFRYRLPLEAALLVLDQTAMALDLPLDFNALRRELGVTELPPLDPAGLKIRELSHARLARLPIAALTHEQLRETLQLSAALGLKPLVRAAAAECFRRQAPGEIIPDSLVYAFLGQVSRDREEHLRVVRQGRAAAEAERISVGPWLLQELQLQAGHDAPAFVAVLQEIMSRHRHDERLLNEVARLMASLGLLTPDGRLRLPVSGLSALGAAPGRAEPAPAPAAAPAPASGLWTPDAPAAAASGAPSKLWLPGQD